MFRNPVQGVKRAAVLAAVLATSFLLTVQAIGESSTAWFFAMVVMTVHIVTDRLIQHRE